MPRFSVIVPVHRVQAYLHGCLDSVLSQSWQDLELIVVDDGSPDACGEIAAEHARRDRRVRVVRLPGNRGPGPARNAGLVEARGEYVLFLDGDDVLAPGALAAVAGRLKETGDPDVLVFAHAGTDLTGRLLPGPPAALLTEQGPAPFRLEDRPGLLRASTAPWNKACRRDFLRRTRLSFPPGGHEDVAWSYPVLLSAKRLATLERVCVHHRVDTPPPAEPVAGVPAEADRGSHRLPEAPPPRSPLDVLDQWDRVFAHVEQYPALERWRPLLFRLMVDRLAEVFADRRRLPGASAGEFLRRARGLHRRHRVEGLALPPRTRARQLLIRLGAHRTYRALLTCALLGRAAARRAGRAGRLLRAAAVRVHYRLQRLLPLREDHAVFVPLDGRGRGGHPGALEEAVRTHVPRMRTAWIAHAEHHHTLPTPVRRLLPGSFGAWTALARAKYLVAETHLDPRFVKRRGQVYVQTRTGTPLASAGLDLLEYPAAGGGTDVAALLGDCARWDWLLSADRHATLTWQRVFPGPYTTLECGRPRADVFLRANVEDVRRARESLGLDEDTVAVLYAPAHRPYRRTQSAPLDVERLAQRLGPGFTLLARAHPRHGGPLAPGAERVVDVSGHPSVETLCLAADALVTDHSSLMTDYAVLDRPIVLHTADWEAYAASRGVYLDLRAFPPGAVARDEDELADIFRTGHWRGSRSAQLRAAFRERFCPWDDGRAAERVVRRVMLGESEPLPFLPPERRVPAPSPALAPRTPDPSRVRAGGPLPSSGAGDARTPV